MILPRDLATFSVHHEFNGAGEESWAEDDARKGGTLEKKLAFGFGEESFDEDEENYEDEEDFEDEDDLLALYLEDDEDLFDEDEDDAFEDDAFEDDAFDDESDDEEDPWN